MHDHLRAPWLALRAGIGLTATLAGIDKFFNLLADWERYLSPIAVQLLPVQGSTFLGLVGVIELAVGVAILAGWTRIGAYVASAWLLGVAFNLVLAGYFDVAVRDVVMSLAAFTLARLEEVRVDAPVRGYAPATERDRRVTA